MATQRSSISVTVAESHASENSQSSVSSKWDVNSSFDDEGRSDPNLVSCRAERSSSIWASMKFLISALSWYCLSWAAMSCSNCRNCSLCATRVASNMFTSSVPSPLTTPTPKEDAPNANAVSSKLCPRTYSPPFLHTERITSWIMGMRHPPPVTSTSSTSTPPALSIADAIKHRSFDNTPSSSDSHNSRNTSRLQANTTSLSLTPTFSTVTVLEGSILNMCFNFRHPSSSRCPFFELHANNMLPLPLPPGTAVVVGRESDGWVFIKWWYNATSIHAAPRFQWLIDDNISTSNIPPMAVAGHRLSGVEASKEVTVTSVPIDAYFLTKSCMASPIFRGWRLNSVMVVMACPISTTKIVRSA